MLHLKCLCCPVGLQSDHLLASSMAPFEHLHSSNICSTVRRTYLVFIGLAPGPIRPDKLLLLGSAMLLASFWSHVADSWGVYLSPQRFMGKGCVRRPESRCTCSCWWMINETRTKRISLFYILPDFPVVYWRWGGHELLDSVGWSEGSSKLCLLANPAPPHGFKTASPSLLPGRLLWKLLLSILIFCSLYLMNIARILCLLNHICLPDWTVETIRVESSSIPDWSQNSQMWQLLLVSWKWFTDPWWIILTDCQICRLLIEDFLLSKYVVVTTISSSIFL